MRAVIFDMDGTLIDSEPLWKEAEKLIFSSVGVTVCETLSAKTASMTTREVTEFWYRNYPWSGKSLEQVEGEVVDRVAMLISQKGAPMEGVCETLEFLNQRKIKIGLSTNAPLRLIPIVLEKLGISHYFHAISSSESENQGKPHPAVYLSTARKLNVEPSRCIAFEDSISGIISAKNAGMKTIAVPSHSQYAEKQYDLSDIKLSSLSCFTEDHLRFFSGPIEQGWPSTPLRSNI